MRNSTTAKPKTAKPPKPPKPKQTTTSKCLMIETTDNRKFFTPENNFERLIEYANTFHSKISVVVPETAVELLDLSQLAEAISTPATQSNVPDVEVVETKIEQDAPKKKRRNLTKYTEEVQKHIRQQFLANKVIGLKELNEDFKNKDLYPAFFFKHIAKVKKDLESEGYKIEKVGTGKYSIISPKKKSYADYPYNSYDSLLRSKKKQYNYDDEGFYKPSPYDDE